MKKYTVLAIAAFFAVGIAQADGKKLGFGEKESSSTESGQGAPAKPNGSANAGNQGQTTVEITEETTGPKGQLKNDRTDCNNCETTITEEVIDLPGKKR